MSLPNEIRSLPNDTTNGIAAINQALATGALTLHGSWTVYNKDTGLTHTLGGIGAARQFVSGFTAIQTATLLLKPDYSEGVWTPRLAGSGGGQKTIATSGIGNAGWWSRIGNLVTVGGTLSWNGAEVLSGNAQMNLPFASRVVADARAAGNISGVVAGSFTMPAAAAAPGGAYTSLALNVDAGQANALILARNADGFSPVTTVGNGGALFFTLSYQVAP